MPLGGRSLQYASATGTGNLGANSGQLTELPDVSLAPGQRFLVRRPAARPAIRCPHRTSPTRPRSHSLLERARSRSPRARARSAATPRSPAPPTAPPPASSISSATATRPTSRAPAGGTRREQHDVGRPRPERHATRTTTPPTSPPGRRPRHGAELRPDGRRARIPPTAPRRRPDRHGRLYHLQRGRRRDRPSDFARRLRPQRLRRVHASGGRADLRARSHAGVGPR